MKPPAYRPPWSRALAVWLAVLVLFGTLADRTYATAVTAHELYRRAAATNRTLIVPLPVQRGRILDRYERVLAEDATRWVLKVVPSNVHPTDPQLARVAAVIGVDATTLLAMIAALHDQVGNEERTLYGPLTPEQVLTLSEEVGLEGQRLVGTFEVGRASTRRYPHGALLAGVVGYTGRIDEATLARLRAQGYRPDDDVGRAGVEATYETELRGSPGYRVYERDAHGRILKLLEERPTIPGRDLVLTIDLALQQRIASELAPGLERADYQSVGAVVEDPQNGQVLALVSLPSYDDNLFVQGLTDAQWRAWLADPAKPLVNRVYADHFPPGSTFKVATGAAALTEHVATRERVICSSGGIQYGSFYFRDWKAHGCIDFVIGLAHSSDVYFYELAGGAPDGSVPGLGERLPRYARTFGYGSPTGLDVPDEASGFIGDPAWKRAHVGEPWTKSDEYFMGIGQGYVAVTPVQQVNFYSAVANGGYLELPHVRLAFLDGAGGREGYTPRFRSELPVPKSDLRLLRESLRRVVTDGHAYMKTSLKVAGKTGTAEYGEATPGKPLPYHNWFVSFLPKGGTADPLGTESELAMAIFMYNTSAGCGDRPFCANPAVSATERIYDWYIGSYRAPDGRRAIGQ